jgi:hypothetical protein
MEFRMSQDQAAFQAMSNFNQVFAEALDRNRAFAMGFAGLLRDESVHFVNLRLDRAHRAMEQLNECKGLPGLLGLQQAWISDWIADATAQGQRFSEFLSQGMNRMQEEVVRLADSVVEAVEPAMEEAREEAQRMAGQAGETMQDTMSHQQDYSQPDYNTQSQVH